MYWQYVEAQEPHVYVATTTPKVEQKVIVEVRPDWSNPERVKQEIEKVFPDAPIMKEVARCESGFKPNAYNPTNNSNDSGVMQISQKYHGKRMRELGLDPFDVQDNLAFARILYDEQGLAPWKWSKPCWN